MSATLGGLPVAGFAVVHAAPIEGHGLEDFGAVALGVGKVASAVRCAELLRGRARGETRAVLLFGIAGACPERLRGSAPPAGVGDLVVVRRDLLGDEGVETPDGFLDLGAMRLGDCGPFGADPRLARAAAERLGAPLVDGVTVSTCSGTDGSARRVFERTGADVETMEGAAIAYVCRQLELPLVHVRAISNWTGDRDRGQWQLGAAVDAVQRAVRLLLRP